MTRVLTRSEVERLIDHRALADGLRAGFVAHAKGTLTRAVRVREDLPGPGTATVLFPGTAPGVPAYTVKVHAKYPAETPALRGLLCLHDAATGALLAVMDSTALTAARTGAAAALATDALARPNADSVAVIGAGAQGWATLVALAALRPLRRVTVLDLDPGRSAAFAHRAAEALGLPARVAFSVDGATQDADVVVTATWARTPFLLARHVVPGTHVTTLGPDEPGKAEVAADVLRDALFVADDRTLAATVGALGGVGLGPEAADAEIGDVLAGTHPGRTHPDQATVYGGVGLPFQDAVAAWGVYQRAGATSAGQSLDFLS